MKNWMNSKFAKDRWTVLRVSHWAYGGRAGTRETKVNVQNKYSLKLATFSLDGEFFLADFPDGIYRGRG